MQNCAQVVPLAAIPYPVTTAWGPDKMCRWGSIQQLWESPCVTLPSSYEKGEACRMGTARGPLGPQKGGPCPVAADQSVTARGVPPTGLSLDMLTRLNPPTISICM